MEAKRPLLILVNGIPGTGKTTTSRRLAQDLQLPCVGKDDIKEFLCDRMEVSTVEMSRDVGKISFDMLYTFMRTGLGIGLDVIVECPFYYEFGRPTVAAIIADTNAHCIEIYCHTDPAVRRRRFKERQESGLRHPGHFDGARKQQDDETDEAIAAKYAPLNLGTLMQFDTTEPSEEAYNQLVQAVSRAIHSARKGEGK